MVKLDYYNIDGANWQAKAVLAYMQAIDVFDNLGIYNEMWHEYNATIFVGRYENCREQGYVFSVKYEFEQRNYVVYEHRNTDRLCVIVFDKNTINTPNLDEVLVNMKDKWDYTQSFEFGKIVECGDWIREDMRKFVTEVKEKNEKVKDIKEVE